MLLAAQGTLYSVGATSSKSESALNQAALAFVRNVANIKLDLYNVTSDCKGPITSLLYPGHTEAVVNLDLISADNQLQIEVEFIDNYLVSYRLTSGNELAVLSTGNSLDGLEEAKETLGKYQAVFNATYSSQLATMTDNIASLDRAQTIETESATLNFNPNASLGSSVTFMWNYKNATRKSLGISINREGFLEWFRDMWGINKVSNSQVKVSEQTALKTATDNANAYAKQLGAKVANVNVTFGYINSYPEARGGDPFVLYPSWDAQFTFDKPYGVNAQGDCITGYFVGVWADTGEVRTAIPQGFWGQSPQPAGNGDSLLAEFGVVVVAIFVVLGAFVLTVRKRQKQNKAR